MVTGERHLHSSMPRDRPVLVGPPWEAAPAKLGISRPLDPSLWTWTVAQDGVGGCIVRSLVFFKVIHPLTGGQWGPNGGKYTLMLMAGDSRSAAATLHPICIVHATSYYLWYRSIHSFACQNGIPPSGAMRRILANGFQGAGEQARSDPRPLATCISSLFVQIRNKPASPPQPITPVHLPLSPVVP